MFVDEDVGLALDQLCHFLGALLALEEGGGLLVDDVKDGAVVIGLLVGAGDQLTELVDLLRLDGIDLLALAGGLIPAAVAGDGDLVALLVQDLVAVLILLVLDGHGLLGLLVKDVLAAGQAPDALLLVVLGHEDAQEVPHHILVLALAAHGKAVAFNAQHIAGAAGSGVADKGDVAAEGLDILVIEQVLDLVDGGLYQHLLALGDAAGGALLVGVVVVFPVKGLREAGGEVQQIDELLAVKAALPGAPVDKLIHVQGQAVLEDAVPGDILVKGLAALRHGGQRRVKLLIGPARGIPHHGAGAHDGVDIEARNRGAELAVHLHGAQHIGEEVVPVQLRVGVDIGVQVLDDALGGQLYIVEAVDVNDIGHIAGHDLGVELGKAGVCIHSLALGAGLRYHIVFGVILYLDAVLVIGPVELDHLILHIVVQIQAAQGDGLLVGHGLIGHLLDSDQVHAGLVGLAIPFIDHAHNAAVTADGDPVQIVAVHIAVDPVEQLLGGALLQLQAIEVAAAGVVQVVAVAAGNGVIEAGRDGIPLVAELFVGNIQQHQLLPRLAVDTDTQLVVSQLHQAVKVVAGLDPVAHSAVGSDGPDLGAIANGDHIAFRIHIHAVGVQIHILIHLDLCTADLGAILLHPADIILLLVLVIVPVVVVVLGHPLRGLAPGGVDVFDGNQPAIVCHSKAVDVAAGREVLQALIVGRRLHALIVGQLLRLTAEIHKIDKAAVNIVLPLILGGDALGDLAADLLPGDGVEAVIGIGPGRVAVFLILQDGLILCHIGKLRVLLLLGLSGLAAVAAALAAGGQTQGHHRHQKQGQNSSRSVFHVCPP